MPTTPPPRPVIVEAPASEPAAPIDGASVEAQAAAAQMDKDKDPAAAKDPDGFATVPEARRHVEALWMALADSLPAGSAWKARLSASSSARAAAPATRVEYFLAGATLPGGGDVRYHLALALWDDCPGTVLASAPAAPADSLSSTNASVERMIKFCREQAQRRAREAEAETQMDLLRTLVWDDLSDHDKLSLIEFSLLAHAGASRPMIWSHAPARNLPAEQARQLAVDVLARLISPRHPSGPGGVASPTEVLGVLGAEEWVRLLVLLMRHEPAPSDELLYLTWGDLGDPDRTAVIQYAEAARLSSWSAAQEAGLPEWRRADLAARPRVEQVAAADRVLARLVGRLLNEPFTPDDVVDILGPVEWNRLLERVVLGQAHVEIVVNS